MYYCPCLYSVVHGYLRLVSDNYLVFHAYVSWNSHVGEYLCTEDLYNSVPTAQKHSHETFRELHHAGSDLTLAYWGQQY